MKAKIYLKSFLAAMICATLPMSSLLAESPFAGGTGTDDDPYLIETIDHLEAVRIIDYVGSSFKLMNDLDLGAIESFAPIWNTPAHARFSGKFDGNGHTIKNVYIRHTEHFIGFFTVLENASVSRLILENVDVEAGGVVGVLTGCMFFNSSVDQVAIINGKVKAMNHYYCGLLAGRIGLDGVNDFNAHVSNCYTTGTVNGRPGSGGITGYLETHCSVKKSYTTATIEGIGWAVAGISGGATTFDNGTVIEGCVTISPSVTTLDPLVDRDVTNGRIVEEAQGTPAYSNNYAYIETECNTITFPEETDPNAHNGKSVSMDELKSATFYAEGPGWAINPTGEGDDYKQIWKIDTEISDYPVFVWQTADKSATKQAMLNTYSVTASNEGIRIAGLTGGENIIIYTVSGAKAGSFVAKGSEAFFPVTAKGVYLVSVNGAVQKVAK